MEEVKTDAKGDVNGSVKVKRHGSYQPLRPSIKTLIDCSTAIPSPEDENNATRQSNKFVRKEVNMPSKTPRYGPRQAERPTNESFRESAKPTNLPTSPLTNYPTFFAPVRHFVLLFSLLIGLFLSVQVLLLYHQISQLPDWLRLVGYILLGVTLSILLFYITKAVAIFLRLRISPQLNLRSNKDFMVRETVRQQISQAEFTEARFVLTHLLQEYPHQATSRLQKLGFKETEVDTLRTTRYGLLNSIDSSDAYEWLEKFDKEFLSLLDSAAKRRTWLYMRSVAIFTAASPRGMFDSFAVLGASYRLIADLCELYNVRTNQWETALILATVLLNIAVASQMGECLDTFQDEVGESLQDLLPDVLDGIFSGIASKALGKGVEGVTNAFLLQRLSVRTQQALRPVYKQ